MNSSLLEKILMNMDASSRIFRAYRAENFAEVAKYAEAQAALAKDIESDATGLYHSVQGDEIL